MTTTHGSSSTEKRVEFTVRLPPWLKTELEEAAHNGHSSMNQFLVEGAILRMRSNQAEMPWTLERLGYDPETQESTRG